MRQFDVTPAFRMELLRIKETTDKDTGGIRGKSIVQIRVATCSLLPDPQKEVGKIVGGAGVKAESSVRQTSFQFDFFGLLFWFRDVYLAFVDKLFVTENVFST